MILSQNDLHEQTIKAFPDYNFMSNPLISVCIPVYNGAPFIEETLQKIYDQSYTHLEILISIDQSIDNSIKICNNLKKTNTKIFIQDTRLGWVGNCNFLISQSSGEYFSIIPHDDLIPGNYYEKLLEGFKLYPHAVNCYPYIIGFGNFNNTIYQKSISGPLQDRIKDVINNHNVAVSFRGLIKNNLPEQVRYLNTDQHQNMMADTIWILQHAIAGELYSIDVPYFKRYHRTNEHASWINKSLDDRISAWVAHCVTLFKISHNHFDHKEKLYQYCVRRLLNKSMNHLNFKMEEIKTDLLKMFEEKTIHATQ